MSWWGSCSAVQFEFLSWSIVFETCFMFQTDGPWNAKVSVGWKSVDNGERAKTTGSGRRCLIWASFQPNRQWAVKLTCLRLCAVDDGCTMCGETFRGKWRVATAEREHADSAGTENYDKWIRALANGSISLCCHPHKCSPVWSITAVIGTSMEPQVKPVAGSFKGRSGEGETWPV